MNTKDELTINLKTGHGQVGNQRDNEVVELPNEFRRCYGCDCTFEHNPNDRESDLNENLCLDCNEEESESLCCDDYGTDECCENVYESCCGGRDCGNCEDCAEIAEQQAEEAKWIRENLM
jgi:hypothetical protein